MTAPPVGASTVELIRERPPLRLNVGVVTPGERGSFTRWAEDERSATRVPTAMSFGSSMPGGFDRFTCTLERKPELTYPDDSPFSTLTVRGPGGEVAWEGRIEKLPDTGGFQSQETVEAVGWQAHLEDDQAAREIYVDRELSKWEGASIARKIALLEAGQDEEDGTTGIGSASEAEALTPALITQITGAIARERVSESWYNAKGIPIGVLFMTWKFPAIIKPLVDLKWQALALLTSAETDVAPRVLAEVAENPNLLQVEGLFNFTLNATSLSETYAFLQFGYTAAGLEDKTYPLYWPTLAVYGAHGLPLHGAASLTEAKGVLASEVVHHAIGKFAPELTATIGREGTIEHSQFVIPQLAFLEPTTAAEMVKQATRFELQDWGVWEDKTFYMNERGKRGNEWRARIGPAQLQGTGPQASKIYNGVVVIYADPSGKQRSVGPPGSGAEALSSELHNPDPENAANEAGLSHTAVLKMGTSTLAGATKVGAIFLYESSRLDRSGQASLSGYAEQVNGTLWPAWKVRAGDTIRFVDAADPSPRRIVSTSYDNSSRVNALQLEQPPETMTAILERLSVGLIGTGLS